MKHDSNAVTRTRNDACEAHALVMRRHAHHGFELPRTASEQLVELVRVIDGRCHRDMNLVTTPHDETPAR
jgi:hypothetical protein